MLLLVIEFFEDEHDYEHEHEKTRTDFSIRVLKFYPTGAVQVNLPFPFGKRRMTVAAESDFQ